MIHYIENHRINEEVLQHGDQLVIVDLFAEWCLPCQEFSDILTDVEKKYNGEVEFYKVNVEESNETKMRYGIQAMPTIIFFKNGEEVERQVGMISEAALMEIIEELK